uniref:Uncharacterized protein n=1 Tax=Mustela putorius furo TaxID=9669 RepID=M3Y5S3_MUSPF
MARGLLAQANRASQRARLGTTFPRMAAGFSPPLPNWLARRHAQTCRRGGRGGEEELSWRHRPETGGGWTPAGALEMKSPVHRAGRRGGGASPEFGAPQASWVYLRSVAECELPAGPTGLPLAPVLRECQLSGLLSAPGAPLIRSRSQHLQNSLPLADLKVCPVLPPTLCPSPAVPRMGGIRLYVFLGRADCM